MRFLTASTMYVRIFTKWIDTARLYHANCVDTRCQLNKSYWYGLAMTSTQSYTAPWPKNESLYPTLYKHCLWALRPCRAVLTPFRKKKFFFGMCESEHVVERLGRERRLPSSSWNCQNVSRISKKLQNFLSLPILELLQYYSIDCLVENGHRSQI